MPTMLQMQMEILSKAKFDGGYPKAVMVMPGVVALAKDEEEFKKLVRHSYTTMLFYGASLLVFTLGVIGMAIYELLVT